MRDDWVWQTSSNPGAARANQISDEQQHQFDVESVKYRRFIGAWCSNMEDIDNKRLNTQYKRCTHSVRQLVDSSDVGHAVMQF